VARSNSIHLVRPQQAPPQPQLDPADIAAEVLSVADECTQALKSDSRITAEAEAIARLLALAP
jgi:hypothetical protein